MNTSLKTAVIGLGRAGWHWHLDPMLAQEGIKITAVADPDSARRNEASSKIGCDGYETIEELLQKADCELVSIATPTTLHFSDAWKVLQAGKHCVLEKPMAQTADEAHALLKLAKSKNLLLAIHHPYLFFEEYHHLREIIQSNVLGRIFHIRGFWANYARRWDWQTLTKHGGGLLNNTGPHILCMTLPFLNSRVTSVTADLQHIKDAGDAEDYLQLFLKTESGATADLTVTTTCAFPGVKWMFMGANGTLTSDNGSTHVKYFDPSKVPMPALEEVTAARERKYNSETLPWQEKTFPVKINHRIPPFYENIMEFLFRNGRLLSPADDAAEISRIIDLARENSITSL